MTLATLSGAISIALASTVLFLLILKTWDALTVNVVEATRFPHSIMLEAAQRFRDQMERLARERNQLPAALRDTTSPTGLWTRLLPIGRWSLVDRDGVVRIGAPRASPSPPPELAPGEWRRTGAELWGQSVETSNGLTLVTEW